MLHASCLLCMLWKSMPGQLWFASCCLHLWRSNQHLISSFARTSMVCMLLSPSRRSIQHLICHASRCSFFRNYRNCIYIYIYECIYTYIYIFEKHAIVVCSGNSEPLARRATCPSCGPPGWSDMCMTNGMCLSFVCHLFAMCMSFVCQMVVVFHLSVSSLSFVCHLCVK